MRFIAQGLSLLACLPLASAIAAEAPETGVVGTITVIGESADDTTGASATRLPLSIRDTPQSITVIDEQRLEDQSLQSLRDVLDNTPGVYSYAYDSERVIFTSRGFVIDSMMLDGVPASGVFATSSIDENIDTALYERIEIVRGATGLLSGAGSPSASVNLVRKHADSAELGLETTLTGGSWNDYRGELDISTPLSADGAVRGRFVGVYQQKESYQDFYEREKKVLYGVVDADLTGQTRLSLGYELQDTLPQSNTWGSFPLFFSDGSRTRWDRSVTTATDWSYWNKRAQTGFVQLDQALPGAWSLRATYTHRDRKDDLALFYVFGYPDPQTGDGLQPYAYREIVDARQDSVDLFASGPFALFGREHELVLGYNGTRAEVRGTEFAPGTLADPGNFFEWDGSYPQPDFADVGTRSTDVDNRQHAVYFVARLQILDPLKLIAGARHTHWKTDYYYLYEGNFVHDHDETVPYAGLIYDVTSTVSLFTSYTGIFNPQNSQAADGQFLDPIDGSSIEVGVKGEHFGGRLNSSLTLFETGQDNVAEPAFDANGQPLYLADGVTQAAVAVDGTQTRGFEFELNGQLLAGWQASLGWSRYLLEDADGESVKSYVPRTLVRAFSTYTPQRRLSKLTVGGGVNWQSASNLDVGAPQGLVNIRQGSVPLLSVMARYRVTSNLSVQINGENLLDRSYYVLDEYGNLYFGTPANGSASVSYRF